MSSKRVALLSNITLEIVGQLLEKDYETYLPNGYNTWTFEILDQNSGLYSEKPDIIFIVLDGRHLCSEWTAAAEGYEQMKEWLAIIDTLAANAQIPVFISSLDLPAGRIKTARERVFVYEWTSYWYNEIQKIAEKYENTFVFPLAALITDMGRKQFYSEKLWYMGSIPYTMKGMTAIADEIMSLIHAAFSKQKKCLALDLDNTLWGGVAGEDGVAGIELSREKKGRCYYDLQKCLIEMKERGVILSILSKNNIEDVEEIFKSHPFMQLKLHDFAAYIINWEEKALNIKKVAETLNLGLDSFVFLDDNNVEREMMAQLSEPVTVINFPKDISRLPELAGQVYLDYFRQLTITDEDRYKTEMYHQEAARQEVRKHYYSLDEYLGSLDIEIKIHRMLPEEIDRGTQLINKTNQFNLTAKRYSKADLLEMCNDSNVDIYSVYVKDKFGDSGLVSMLIMKKDINEVTVDSFLMSCRIMGRKIEYAIMNEISNFYFTQGKQLLRGLYKVTPRNTPAGGFYDNLGFTCVSHKGDEKVYTKRLAGKAEQAVFYKKISFKE